MQSGQASGHACPDGCKCPAPSSAAPPPGSFAHHAPWSRNPLLPDVVSTVRFVTLHTYLSGVQRHQMFSYSVTQMMDEPDRIGLVDDMAAFIDEHFASIVTRPLVVARPLLFSPESHVNRTTEPLRVSPSATCTTSTPSALLLVAQYG